MPIEKGDILTEKAQFWDPIKRGDPEALGHLFDTYFPDLYALARRLGASEDDVYDLIQDLFADLWEAREKLPEEIKTRPYLFRMVRNKLYDTHKRKQRFSKEPIPDIADQAKSAEELWITEETTSDQRQKLQQLLRQLPERQLELLLLRFVHGFSYEEIEQITGLRYQSVRNGVHKALKHLRDWIIVWLAFFLIKI